MTSLTVENYLKAILQIELRSGCQTVSTGQLASAALVSPGTVTSMLKTLADAGLADYRPYEGVTLTDQGRLMALRMLRRHRLIELFLVQTLQLTWDQVHDEAEHMEHAVSDFLVDRIDDFLGHPDYDPHGDPIPSSSGQLRGASTSSLPLTDCGVGAAVRFTRVMNQDPEFLRFLADAGLAPGAIMRVSANHLEAAVIEVQAGDQITSLAHQAAQQLLVEPVVGGVSS